MGSNRLQSATAAQRWLPVPEAMAAQRLHEVLELPVPEEAQACKRRGRPDHKRRHQAENHGLRQWQDNGTGAEAGAYGIRGRHPWQVPQRPPGNMCVSTHQVLMQLQGGVACPVASAPKYAAALSSKVKVMRPEAWIKETLPVLCAQYSLQCTPRLAPQGGLPSPRLGAYRYLFLSF